MQSDTETHHQKKKKRKKKKREGGWDPTSEEPRRSPEAWNGEDYLVLGLCHNPRSTVAGSNPH